VSSPAAPDALAAAAERYSAALPPGAVVEVDVTPYDRTGVPTAAATWRSAGDPRRDGHGVGYGTSPLAARVGALGELAEHALPLEPDHRPDPVTGSYAELVRRRGADRVADPRTLVLPAGCDADPRDPLLERPLLWLPMTRWGTGEEVLVPAELAAPSGAAGGEPPSGTWLTTPISNGMGAGETLERALGHAIGELVQRDGDTVDFRALDSGVVVDEAGIADAATLALLQRLRGLGIDPVVKLDSTELAVVVHVAGRDDRAGDPAVPPVAVSAVGEAAHPDREEAVRKAVLEFCSSRARRAFAFGPLEEVRRRDPEHLAAELAVSLPEQESRALEAMTGWTARTGPDLARLLAPTLLGRRTSVSFTDLPTSPRAAWETPQALLETWLERLRGFDVLSLAWTRTTPDGEPVHAVKAVVPGLEVETLSYLRIGERVLRRLLDRGSDLVGLGAPTTADQLPVVLTPEATERVGGPAWLDRAAVERTVGDLYPLYREPTRHAPQRLAAGLG